MQADDPEHDRASKKLKELGVAKYEQELKRSGHQGNADIRAGWAAIAEYKENQIINRHNALKDLNNNILDAQKTGNNIQRGVLIVLFLTLLVSVATCRGN